MVVAIFLTFRRFLDLDDSFLSMAFLETRQTFHPIGGLLTTRSRCTFWYGRHKLFDPSEALFSWLNFSKIIILSIAFFMVNLNFLTSTFYFLIKVGFWDQVIFKTFVNFQKSTKKSRFRLTLFSRSWWCFLKIKFEGDSLNFFRLAPFIFSAITLYKRSR